MTIRIKIKERFNLIDNWYYLDKIRRSFSDALLECHNDSRDWSLLKPSSFPNH